MKYIELVNKARNSTRESASHMKEQVILVFFRKLGFYAAPIFLWMNISANTITTLGLILGILASALIWNQSIIFGILVYFIVVLLDHVDGTIARVKKEATFYGRFIDGFFGIITYSILRMVLSFLVVHKNGLDIIVWIGIVSAVLTPMHHLFYDRYSTFVRWIKDEGHNVETKPYLRPNAPRSTNIINDLQHILLFGLPIYYYFTDYWDWVLLTYFLLNIYLAIHTLIYYTKSAYTHFRVSAKPHR